MLKSLDKQRKQHSCNFIISADSRPTYSVDFWSCERQESGKKDKAKSPSEFQEGCFVWSAVLTSSSKESSNCWRYKNRYCRWFKSEKIYFTDWALKDSIQDSLDVAASNDGKLNDAVVRIQFNTKFPSAIR